MKTLSGNKEADFLILNELSDYELGKVCKVNKYINSLCNDDIFWLNRIMFVFKMDSKTASEAKEFFEFDNWKELYIYLLNQTKEHEKIIAEIGEKDFTDSEIKEELAKYVKKYVSYKSEIDKMFELITYPEWIIKDIFERERKRNYLWSSFYDHTAGDITGTIYDGFFEDFRDVNEKVIIFIKSL